MKNKKQITKNNKQKGATMKTTFGLLLVVVGLLIVLVPLSAFAGGTPAGTTITNQATVKYKNAGGVDMDSVTSNITSVLVDKKSGITITPTTRSVVVGDSVYVTYAATITNTGNYKDLINLSAASQLFQSNGVEIYKDTDQDGVLDAGEITSTIAVTDSVAADASFYIVTRIFTTYGTSSGVKDTTTVTATLQYTGDGTKSAIQKDEAIISRVTFGTTSKTVSNSSPQPGANVVYTVRYLNTGTSNAQNVTLFDVLPSDVTYFGSLVADSGGTVYRSNTSPDSIVFSTASIPAGRGVGFHFTVTVNNGTVSGTTINNSATLVYTDSINGRRRTSTAGPTPMTVSDKLGWTLVIDTIGGTFSTNNATDSTQSGVEQEFMLKITNNGNRSDTAAVLQFLNSNPLTWSVFKDTDKNGTGDSALTSFTSTGNVAPNGGSNWYVVKVTPATNVADRTLDSAFYKLTSLTSVINDTVTGYHKTRILAPIMQLTKNVTKVNTTARPGDTLQYVINYQNVGSGYASAVVVTDLVPTNTTYVPSTVATSPDGTTYTPLADGSAGNPQSSGVVSVNLGTLTQGKWGAPASSKGYIKFRVVIN